MILTFAIFLILTEAIIEALIKKRYPSSDIFKGWLQWVIAIGLFLGWLWIAYTFSSVPLWKLIVGFVFIRFAIFDIAFNLTFGLPIYFIGTTKLYDRLWQWFFRVTGFPVNHFFGMLKFICLCIGITWLLTK